MLGQGEFVLTQKDGTGKLGRWHGMGEGGWKVERRWEDGIIGRGGGEGLGEGEHRLDPTHYADPRSVIWATHICSPKIGAQI